MNVIRIAVLSLLLSTAAMPARASVWFVRAGQSGDGASPENPLGSSAALEALTKPGDTILMLPGEQSLDGGIALKPGQILLGLPLGDRKPSITNTSTNRNNGNGIVLADNCKVFNVRLEKTSASGVLGVDVSGTLIDGVDVHGSNQTADFTGAVAQVLGPIPHAGFLYLATRPKRFAENQLRECSVTDAAGIGIAAVALGGGRQRLIVRRTRTENGSAIPPLFDAAFLALADGPSSETQVELADIVSKGRLTDQGRNALIFASADARATACIERSHFGICGQDGVVAVAAMVPATVEVVLRDTIIEKAGQMNIEGTVLNLPPSDPSRAGESLVSLDVDRCIIREAGAAGGFRDDAENIWFGPTFFGSGSFAKGRYRLSVRNSTVEKASHNGIRLGADGAAFKIGPDESDYDAVLLDNTIRENGPSDITLSAANARVVARKNWWGTPSGLSEDRIILIGKSNRAQLDATLPLTRQPETVMPSQPR